MHITQSSPQDPQGQILQAARELMSLKGFGAMSMRALAGRVGLQPGSLYHHFRSKADLLEEIAEAALCDRLHDWWAHRPKRAEPTEQLKAFIAFHYDRSRQHFDQEHWLMAELRHLGCESRARIEEHHALYLKELEQLIVLAARSTDLQVRDVRIAARAVLALLDGLVGASAEGKHSPAQASADEVTELAFKLFS